MSTIVNENSFDSLFQRLRTIDLFGSSGPPLPFQAPPMSDAVRAAIGEGTLLPPEFRDAYAKPLLADLDAVVQKLNGSQQPEIVETLAGAVYQHAQTELAAPLGRFLAVISDLYRSFLSKKRRIAAGFP